MSDIQIPAEARVFIEDILSYMELDNADPEVKEQMVEDMFLSLDRFMHARALDALPDDQLDAYEQLVNSGGTPDDVQQFFAKHIPNLQQVLTSAAAEFKLSNMPQQPTEQ